jgi:GR25 family glycosyltransferase involved in LPS biosynthesis
MKGLLLVLPERKERAQHIVEVARALNIDIELVDAIDARKPDTLKTILEACPVHTKFHLGLPRVMHCIIGKPGALGCYMSHMKAWKAVAAMKEPAFIFEDDVNLDKHSQAIVDQMYQLCKQGTFDCI